jgi:hypothetical protein
MTFVAGPGQAVLSSTLTSPVSMTAVPWRWATSSSGSEREIGPVTTEPAPVIKIDALRYWIPKKDKEVDFTEVREYILDLARKGFKIKPGHLRPVGVCRYA